ncbi:MAG: tRNA dihydrouridine synthase DusB [Pseudomonadota bacterium]
MKIGSLELKGRTVLAPLAGFTNLPFRRLVKHCGCSLVCSEMISAKGLVYNSRPTFALLDTMDEERPLSVQLFGDEPGSMAKAAAIVEKTRGADVIDLNFGCSVKKVTKTGAGVSLMKNPAAAEAIIKSVRDAITIPLTIKIRSGWDPSGVQALEIAHIAQNSGIDAITVHPRSAGQGFRGRADWDLIRTIKSQLSIPVIGNGDVITPEQGAAMVRETGCDAVMVGRAALGNPFIFADIDALLEGKPCPGPGSGGLFLAMEELIRSYGSYFGEDVACRMLRGRLGWFVKGMPGCSVFRKGLSEIRSLSHALDLIHDFEQGQTS